MPAAVQSISGTVNTSYTYDANGNTLSGNDKTYAWTAFNKPWRIDANGAESQFWYAPDRSRYKQVTTNGGVATTTLYIGGLFDVIAEDGAATIYRHNIIAGGRIVAIYTNTSALTQQIRYLHYSALGSVNAVTDGSGTVVARMSFSAFGVRRDPADWQGPDPDVPNDRDQTFRGYTNQEELDGVGLIHYNGRVYDAVVGRFVSADPYVQFPYCSQSLNRYSYVVNNPLTYGDSTGFDTECASGGGTYAQYAAAGMALGTVTGGILGKALGATVGGAIGSSGDFFGPEVGVPSTLLGVVIGKKFGTKIGAAAGASIGRNVGLAVAGVACNNQQAEDDKQDNADDLKKTNVNSKKKDGAKNSNESSKNNNASSRGSESGNGGNSALQGQLNDVCSMGIRCIDMNKYIPGGGSVTIIFCERKATATLSRSEYLGRFEWMQ